MSHGPAGERARRPWGRYNYAFIAEISFCFSDAILVSRTGGGEEGRGKKGEWHSVLPGCRHANGLKI